jgi:hypothetical protein
LAPAGLLPGGQVPFFTISVTRRAETPYVRAQAGMIWYGIGGREEVALAEVTLELERGPAREVLALSLEALAAALRQADQGV